MTLKAYRLYVILPNTAEIRDSVHSGIADGHIVQTSVGTLRLSGDNQYGIVKWNHVQLGHVPARIRDYISDNTITIHTHEDILAVIAVDPNWADVAL